MEIRPAAYDGQVARELVAALLLDLNGRYGPGQFDPVDPALFAPPEGLFLVAWEGPTAVACGAFRRVDPEVAEVKRMYVAAAHRRRGRARAILAALEAAASAAGYRSLRLETGTLQPEAIGLYGSAGFTRIDCYPPFDQDPTSVCFAKALPDPSTFSR